MVNPVESKAIERLMKGCRLGSKVYHYDILESTQIEAKRLAKEGAPEGTLVIARTQTKGYGRQGAFWHSSPGGLWFSLVLYPTFEPEKAPQTTLRAAVAIKSVLESFCPETKFEVKPPNDILAQMDDGSKKKVCGIMVEGQVQANRYESLVLGVGVNVDNDLSEELQNQAATLRGLSGRLIPRMRLLKEILMNLDSIFL